MNPLDVISATEVIPVGTFGQPAPLTFGFAGSATIGRRAEGLVMHVPVIRREKLPATPAFATNYFAAHPEPQTAKTYARIPGKKKTQEDPKEKKEEELSG